MEAAWKLEGGRRWHGKWEGEEGKKGGGFGMKASDA